MPYIQFGRVTSSLLNLSEKFPLLAYRMANQGNPVFRQCTECFRWQFGDSRPTERWHSFNTLVRLENEYIRLFDKLPQIESCLCERCKSE